METPEISKQDRQLLLSAYQNDATVHRLLDDQASLSEIIVRLVADKRELGKQLEVLYPGPRIVLPNERNVVTCVYCGHEYPDGTPAAKAELLTEHIKVCREHPMRAAEAEIAKLKAEVESLKTILASKVGKGLLLFMGQVKLSKEMVKTDEGLLRWTGMLSGFVSAILADVTEERMEALIAKINDFGDGVNPQPEWTEALCNFLRWEAREGREKEADMIEGEGQPS